MNVLEKIKNQCDGRLDVEFERKGEDTVAVVNVPKHVCLSPEEWNEKVHLGCWPVLLRRNGVDSAAETTPGAPPWFSVQNVPSTATSPYLWRPDDETMVLLIRAVNALEKLGVRSYP